MMASSAAWWSMAILFAPRVDRQPQHHRNQGCGDKQSAEGEGTMKPRNGCECYTERRGQAIRQRYNAGHTVNVDVILRTINAVAFVPPLGDGRIGRFRINSQSAAKR